MNKEREGFEKLSEIAEKIKRSRLNFSKGLNRYLTSSMSDDDQFDCDFVNGAWYAWQAAKAQTIPDGFVVVPIASILKILDAASSLAPIKTMIEAGE